MTRPGPRILLIPVAVVVVLGAIVWWLFGRREDLTIEASGTVEALEADLAFRFPGTIADVMVEEGEGVAAGDTVAALRATDQQGARDQAAAALEAARQQLAALGSGRPQEIEQARAASTAAARRLDEARAELDRAHALYQGRAISRRDLDRAETAYAVAAADQIRAAEQLSMLQQGARPEQKAAQSAMVAQAEAALVQAEDNVELTRLRAPFDGVVTVRHRDPGETVAAGAPVVTVMSPNDRWVRIYVPEAQVGRLRVGQAARITSDAWPGRAYGGRVVFLAQEAEFTPANVQTEEERVKLVFEVKVRITDDPDYVLKPGTPADVTILPDDE